LAVEIMAHKLMTISLSPDVRRLLIEIAKEKNSPYSQIIELGILNLASEEQRKRYIANTEARRSSP
jgi:predicted transcriptional regulator